MGEYKESGAWEIERSANGQDRGDGADGIRYSLREAAVDLDINGGAAQWLHAGQQFQMDDGAPTYYHKALLLASVGQ